MSDDASKEKIRDLTLRSGYILENEICTYLNNVMKVDWLVSHYPFVDIDTGKDRELDIYARYECEDEEGALPLSFTFLIECKMIPGNVLVLRRLPSFWKGESEYPILNFYTILEVIGMKDFEIYKKLSDKENNIHFFDSKNYYNDFQEYVINKKLSNRRNDNIFESNIKVIKASHYEVENYKKNSISVISELYYEGFWDKVTEQGTYISLSCPLIIFDGDMYEVLLKDNELIPRKIKHAQLITQIKNKLYEGSYAVDIINPDYIETYFNKIKNDEKIIRNIQKTLSEDYKNKTKENAEIYFKKLTKKDQ